MADDSRAGLVKRRPRRSNSLKDLQRLLAPAGMTYEQSRKDRLATTASYLVRPVEGARSLDLRRRFMELELSGTGLLPPKPDVPFDEPHRFGKLLDILDGGGEIPQPRPAIKAPAQSNLPPVRDPTLEVKVRGWSGLPRAKILDKEARRLDKEYVKPRRPDEDKLLNASRGKLSTEIERQRSGDLQWLKVEADIARIESDDRALWRTLKKFDEAMSGKLVRGHRLGGFKPCADPYWHPIVVEAERRWIAALDALETSRFKPDFGVIDPFAPLPEKSAALKRVDRDRATLNSDTMQLRIEAVEALRIDLWQEWKPTRHDGEPMGASWQTLATVLEAMGQVRRAELYREWRARGNSDKKPKRRLREVPAFR